MGGLIGETPTETACKVLRIFRGEGDTEIDGETYAELFQKVFEDPGEVIETLYRIGLKLPRERE